MNDKLNEALDHIGDVHLFEAVRPRRRRAYWVYAVAALLALALILWPILRRQTEHRDTQPEPLATTTHSSVAAVGAFPRDHHM